MNYFRFLLGGALGVLFFAGSGTASPITYTQVGYGSGSLNGQAFSGLSVLLSLTTDTSSITGGPTFFTNMGGTVLATVSGLTTDTLPNASVFVIQTFAPPAAGFGDSVAGGSIMDTFNSVFAAYALGPIGPTAGASFIRSDLTYATGTGGIFYLTSVGDTTFTAAATAAPLPAALPLFSGGLGVMGLLSARRRPKVRAN